MPAQKKKKKWSIDYQAKTWTGQLVPFSPFDITGGFGSPLALAMYIFIV